jgi:outer membrane protein assembly factor BamE (lipoprotein component of BamABCDE complex)
VSTKNAIVALTLAGCVQTHSVGAKVDLAKVDELKMCSSTREDVRRSLPEPSGTGRVGTLATWRWGYVSISASAFSVQPGAESQSVVVAFDEDGRVVDVAVNQPASYAVRNRCKDKD